MHPRTAALAPLVCAAVASACFDFDATSSGGPLVDGGSDSADAAFEANDAAADVASQEAGGGPFCASLTRPTSPGSLFFCDDFDEGPLPGSWSVFHETSGTLVESGGAAVSPPNALDETIGSVASGQAVDVALRTPLALPPLPSKLTFAFSVDPVRLDATANAAIVLAAIDFLDGAGSRYSVELSIQVQSGAATMILGEQSGLADGGQPYVSHPLPPANALATGTFTDLAMAIDWTGTKTAKATVLVNGAQALDVPLGMTVQAASLQIGVGTSYVSEPSPGWEIRYDNVVFTAM